MACADLPSNELQDVQPHCARMLRTTQHLCSCLRCSLQQMSSEERSCGKTFEKAWEMLIAMAAVELAPA